MQSNKKTGNDKSIISYIMNTYLPYWPLFLILVVVCLALAWAYMTFYANPVYEIYATVMVNDDKKGVDESGVLEALEVYPTKNIVENEMEVIHSRKLMEQVVQQLQLYAPVYEGHVFLNGKFNSSSAYTSSPVTIVAKNPYELKETSDTDVDISFHYYSPKAPVETLNAKGNIKEVIIDNKVYPLNVWCSTPYGVLKFVPNTRQKSIPQGSLYFDLYKPNNIATYILLNLIAQSNNKLSSTIDLVLRDEVPQRGEDILNNLLLTYNRLSMEEKKGMGNNTLDFIDKRLAGLQKEIDSIEHHIQSFKTNQGVVDLTEQSKMYLDNVGSTDRKIADLSMQLAGLDQMEAYVNSNEKGADILPGSMGITDPVLSDLMNKLYTAKVEYDALLKTTAENNPTALAAAKQIEQLRPLILGKLKSQRIALEAGKKDLESTSGSYNSVLSTMPQKERELLTVSREQDIKKEIYSLLLDKREQAALASASATSENKIVDMAQPSILPVSPKKILIYFAAFVGAIGIGVGIVSSKELLNKKILFRSEIETFTQVPVIAEISASKENESLLVTNSRASVVAEQFRHLRAAIGLFKRQKRMNVKKILVTSSISQEGKTFISTNLATSLALAGNKVVLVDLDIRIPKTSTLMGVVHLPGVSEFLEGTKTPEEIIVATKNENLFVIGAGAGKDNSRELILSGKLNSLLAYLSSSFDYIIMDASPIDPVSDSYIFSEYCDITLFVIRHGRTPKAMVQILDSNNKFKALKNPQIVFNGIRSRGVLKHMYGYGYGYGYENVYRDRQQKKVSAGFNLSFFKRKKYNGSKQQVL